MILYILKVKGVAKIPNYVQIRDEKFSLLAYIRLDRLEKLKDIKIEMDYDKVRKIVIDAEYGKMLKIELK